MLFPSPSRGIPAQESAFALPYPSLEATLSLLRVDFFSRFVQILYGMTNLAIYETMPRDSLSERLRRLGERLRDHRRQRGWTQRGLSARARIGTQRLSRIENGHNVPSLAESVRLASAFDISLDDLVLGRRSSKGSNARTFLARDLGIVSDLTEPEELIAISKTLELFARLLRQCRAPRKAP
jgi:transcriptional regulator with XRE-family HTH domain